MSIYWSYNRLEHNEKSKKWKWNDLKPNFLDTNDTIISNMSMIEIMIKYYFKKKKNGNAIFLDKYLN